MSAFAVHDPDAILDYGFDWSDWLSTGESLDTSTWSGPSGVTLTPSISGDTALVRVEVTDSSLVGARIELVNHVVSSDGQEDDRTLKLYLSNR